MAKKQSNKDMSDLSDTPQKLTDKKIEVKTIEPNELKQDDLLLDIRPYLQRAQKALARPHWHISFEDLDPAKFIKDYHLDGSKTLYIICRTGRTSLETAKAFIRAGFKNVASVNGGILRAKEQGLNLIEHPVWDIQRQVHFVAGLLVTLSCLFGFFSSTLFYLIAFIIGIFLIISGVTGQCTLSKILKKMPWNQ